MIELMYDPIILYRQRPDDEPEPVFARRMGLVASAALAEKGRLTEGQRTEIARGVEGVFAIVKPPIGIYGSVSILGLGWGVACGPDGPKTAGRALSRAVAKWAGLQ